MTEATQPHYHQKDDSEARNGEPRQTSNKREIKNSEASALSRSSDGLELKSLTIQNPTSLPARASAWVIENPGSGNSKRGTANHRKRRRGAKERAGSSLLATSSTENAEVIDLTSNNNTDIPVFAKRWYKH